MGNQIYLPRTFHVAVDAGGFYGGRGNLEIASGSLVCRLNRVMSSLTGISLIEQRDSPVSITVARLIPFWFNVSVVMEDRQNRIRLFLWIFGLRALHETLEAAGFEVKIRRTWFSRGPGPRVLGH
jgi:hypothetical protein